MGVLLLGDVGLGVVVVVAAAEAVMGTGKWVISTGGEERRQFLDMSLKSQWWGFGGGLFVRGQCKLGTGMTQSGPGLNCVLKRPGLIMCLTEIALEEPAIADAAVLSQVFPVGSLLNYADGIDSDFDLHKRFLALLFPYPSPPPFPSHHPSPGPHLLENSHSHHHHPHHFSSDPPPSPLRPSAVIADSVLAKAT